MTEALRATRSECQGGEGEVRGHGRRSVRRRGGEGSWRGSGRRGGGEGSWRRSGRRGGGEGSWRGSGRRGVMAEVAEERGR